jgi:uncharacterized Ntn-hydrolase superfamily protein
MYLSTFSIVARCRRTGMFGVAVSTRVPAVGMLCPFVQAGVGAIATQARVNPYLGIDGLKLLAQDWSAQSTLDKLLIDDPMREGRQLAIVDNHGRVAAYTGPQCNKWAGHYCGDGYSVQGNILVGKETIDAMAQAFDVNEPDELPERLLKSLEAGQAAGGDRRGRQSAVLKVFDKEEYAYVDLRVDEHPDPVAELRRVFTVASQSLLPYIKIGGLPTRANPSGISDEEEITRRLKAIGVERTFPAPLKQSD